MNDQPTIRLINEKDLQGFDGKMPDVPTVYFKIVSIGENTLNDNEHDPAKLMAMSQEQPGFFLVGEDQEAICDSIHQIVMRFRAAWLGDNNESES